MVGQLAKAKGCRAIGFAGGPDKCRYVTDELGFDACIDYKAHADPKALYGALKAVTPDGIDGHFENVGGAALDAVLLRINDHKRIALCGMISGYNGEPIPIRNPSLILTSRLRIQGFIVSEHMEHWPAALTELGTMVATGKLKYRETIAEGLDAAPAAFFGHAQGKELRQAARETLETATGATPKDRARRSTQPGLKTSRPVSPSRPSRSSTRTRRG